ncbi:hypothetical protein JTE90_023675 [Oedothorax gibbosus]|uniref:RING-type domain-containing protein n=1 Tax=Oedothorax gibbosus TaxID=931172 RepID=A0AAV6U895_9ARAC|nr:hypothetical protein JTE90_023675 [Oedothorax gibbosus]
MSNTCPICFEDLVKKNRATPDICDHIFCFPCLEKWSKHGSYCPVDRKRFRRIVNLDSETVIQGTWKVILKAL